VTEIAFLHPARIHLVWLALAACALLAWLDLRGARQLEAFVAAPMQARLAIRPARGRRVARIALFFVALVAGVLALMRPQARQATQEAVKTRTSADIMVVLDTSRSMLAEDAAPNRLARAKAEIRDLIAPLAGSRLGLMAFAGRAAVLCPLTLDHSFFRLVLDTVDTRSAGRGGTRIGDALRQAVAAFPTGGESARLILLFTDGEDHDSYALDAAKEAHTAGVRVVAVGFGDEKGSEVTLVDPRTGARSTLLDREGHAVRSRLDGETLRSIALATEGAYVPAGVASLDIRSIIDQHVKPLLREAPTAEVRVVRAERYPWFLIASLAALGGALWAGTPPSRRRRSPTVGSIEERP
jgi:Ca-activated chloride channel family protein